MLEGQRRLALHQGKFAPDPGRTPLGQTAGLLSAWHDSGQERFRLHQFLSLDMCQRSVRRKTVEPPGRNALASQRQSSFCLLQR